MLFGADIVLNYQSVTETEKRIAAIIYVTIRVSTITTDVTVA